VAPVARAAASSDFDDDEVWETPRRSRPRVVAAAVAGLIALVLVIRALSGSSAATDLSGFMRASHLGTITIPPPPAALTATAEESTTAPVVNVNDILEKQKAKRGARADRSPGNTERTQVFGAPHPAIPGVEAIDRDKPSKLGAIVSPDEEVTYVGRGNVLVATVPSGAAVMLDGRFLGRTPMNVSWDLARDAEVELVLADYESRSFQLTPRASSGLVRIELQPAAEASPD